MPWVLALVLDLLELISGFCIVIVGIVAVVHGRDKDPRNIGFP